MTMNNKTSSTSFNLSLIKGFCKQNVKFTSIPIPLYYLIQTYFSEFTFLHLFNIEFKYTDKTNIEEALTSISSIVTITNTCYMLTLKISTMKIEIFLDKSIIKYNNETFIIKTKNDKIWKFDETSQNEIQIIIRINRQTQCKCLDSNGKIKICFRNEIDTDYNSISSDDIKYSKDYDGIIEMPLNIDNKNKKVTIEAYNIKKIKPLSNKQAILSCGEYGFGSQCCSWAAYELSQQYIYP